MQGIWVQSLVQEDFTCHGVTKPVSHNYWAWALQQEKPPQQEAQARKQESSSHSWTEPVSSNKDPAQPLNRHIQSLKKKKKKLHIWKLLRQYIFKVFITRKNYVAVHDNAY